MHVSAILIMVLPDRKDSNRQYSSCSLPSLPQQPALLLLLPAGAMRKVHIIDRQVGAVARIRKIHADIGAMRILYKVPVALIAVCAMRKVLFMHPQIGALRMRFHIDSDFPAMPVLHRVDGLR